MSSPKRLKSTEPPVLLKTGDRISAANAPSRVKPPVTGDTHPGAKRAVDFMLPRMPGAFRPVEVRKMTLEALRDRYLTVYSASMGNHSMALFYCCWDPDQFEAAKSVKFLKRIEFARAQLADRATFMMHRGMGLIDTGEKDLVPMPANAYSALGKLVEKLNERTEHEESGGGFKLVVEGLERTQAPVPPAAEAERIPQRDG